MMEIKVMATTNIEATEESRRLLFENLLGELRANYELFEPVGKVGLILQLTELTQRVNLSVTVGVKSRWKSCDFNPERAEMIRQKAGLTQEALAKLSNLSERSIRRFEKGQFIPKWTRDTKGYLDWLEKQGYFEN